MKKKNMVEFYSMAKAYRQAPRSLAMFVGRVVETGLCIRGRDEI